MIHEEMVRRPDNKGALAVLGHEVKSSAVVLGSGVLLMWILEMADQFVFHHALDAYGIRPRAVDGLAGILAAPFLHGGFGHLVSNTLPFIVMGGLIMMRSKREWALVTFASVLVGGLGVWLFGAAHSVHIGASGVVFGYFGYLVSHGYFSRKFGAILLSLLVAFLYGGIIYGVLPGAIGISWEGHLFGMIGGILSGWWLHRRASRDMKLLIME